MKFGNGNFWANWKKENSGKQMLKLLQKMAKKVICKLPQLIPTELQCLWFFFLTQEWKSRNVIVYNRSRKIHRTYIGSFDHGILVWSCTVSSPLFRRSRLLTQWCFASRMQTLCKVYVGFCFLKNKNNILNQITNSQI